MDDKTIIDITNLDAEKHAENAAKRVAAYSEKLRHHASILSEKEYQKFLLERLEKDNGYVIRKASNFDRYFAVDREMLFKFLEDTQHETMEYLRKYISLIWKRRLLVLSMLKRQKLVAAFLMC